MTGARNTSRRFAVELPGWLDVFLAEWNEPLDDLRGRMELAVALSGENVRRGSGGPFGAIVVEEGAGRLLGAGVNLVTAAGLSLAHAEIIALSVAQAAIESAHPGTVAMISIGCGADARGESAVATLSHGADRPRGRGPDRGGRSPLPDRSGRGYPAGLD